jgi:hypothetical protein
MERRIRLGELLLRAGIITDLQLNAALAEQKKWGGRLGRILVDMNFISEEILVKGLARLLQVPRADLSQISVPDEIMRRFDPNDCQNRGYLPLRYHAAEKKLTLAMIDVNDLNLLDELRFKHGFNLEPVIAGEHALLEKARALFYGASVSTATHDGGLKLMNNLGSTMVESRPSAPPATAQPAAPPPAAAQPPSAQRPAAQPTAQDLSAQLSEIVSMQRRQSKAIKTVVELLIQKGVFSLESFSAAVGRRPG